MNEPLAVMDLSNQVKLFCQRTTKKLHPIILCIGTDRATGDSLGPLTGWRLQSLFSENEAEILGTVDNPVHASNLGRVIDSLSERINDHPIIAVDACLGRSSSVGNIVFYNGPLKPGTAVNKTLPEVGDVGITGIVNVGGFMELQVLQNTRLSIVLKMSSIIANSIFLGIRH
jgi:putative sporulation protein YyaC